MTSRRIKVLAPLLAFSVVAAACGGDDDDATPAADEPAEAPADEPAEPADEPAGDLPFAGEQVTILGPERGVEAEGFVSAFAPLEERTGIEIVYTGTADATTELNLAIEAGSPPDITMIPQPGRILAFAAEGEISPLSDEAVANLAAEFDPIWGDLVTLDGSIYAVPNKADAKSLVYYRPSFFEANGYEIPTTWDELEALTEAMKAAGTPPWCVGIGSGDATGWPLTDWMEDIMLRLHGPDVYDQWVNHEIPFNDPKVAEVAQFVGDMFFEEGNVLGGRDVIASTDFKEAGLPLADDACGLLKQANFFASNYVELGLTVGPGGDVDVFYLPTISDEFGDVFLSAGNYAVAFGEGEAVDAVMAYMASAEYADTRIMADVGGYLSPNKTHDTSLYSSDLDRSLAEILTTADPVRFDASDLMPGEVGSGEFWRSGTDWISGAITLEEFLDNTETAWP